MRRIERQLTIASKRKKKGSPNSPWISQQLKVPSPVSGNSISCSKLVCSGCPFCGIQGYKRAYNVHCSPCISSAWQCYMSHCLGLDLPCRERTRIRRWVLVCMENGGVFFPPLLALLVSTCKARWTLGVESGLHSLTACTANERAKRRPRATQVY